MSAIKLHSSVSIRSTLTGKDWLDRSHYEGWRGGKVGYIYIMVRVESTNIWFYRLKMTCLSKKTHDHYPKMLSLNRPSVTCVSVRDHMTFSNRSTTADRNQQHRCDIPHWLYCLQQTQTVPVCHSGQRGIWCRCINSILMSEFSTELDIMFNCGSRWLKPQRAITDEAPAQKGELKHEGDLKSPHNWRWQW